MSDFLSKKITRMSFIFSIMVIFIHTMNLSTFDFSNTHFIYVENFFTFLASVAVPSFFIISGYLFFLNCEKITDVLKKMKKRFFTLVIPYLLWNIIYLIEIALLYSLPIANKMLENPDAFQFTLKNVLYAIFLAGYSGFFWYVRMLIIFVAISPLYFYILKNKYISLCVLIGFFVLLLLGIIGNDFLRLNSFFWFFAGAFLVKHFNINSYIPPFKHNTISFASIAVVLINTLLSTFIIIALPANIGLTLLVNLMLVINVICTFFAMDLVVTSKILQLKKHLSLFIARIIFLSSQ